MDLVCPAYADDIVIMATSLSSLQVLLNHAYHFSCKWRLSLNTSKSALVVFRQDKTPAKEVTLRGSIIHRIPAHPYLGTLLAPAS